MNNTLTKMGKPVLKVFVVIALIATLPLVTQAVDPRMEFDGSLEADSIKAYTMVTRIIADYTLGLEDFGILLYDDGNACMHIFALSYLWLDTPNVHTQGDLTVGDDATIYGGLNVGTATGAGTGDVKLSGDLTVDSNVLKVDATNNMVGMGTANPTSLLHLYDSGWTKLTIAGGSVSGCPLLQLKDEETGGSTWNIENGREDDGILGFYLGGSGTKMKLDSSGNLTVSGDVVLPNLPSGMSDYPVVYKPSEYGGDDKLYYVMACPYIYIWDGTQWVKDTTVIHQGSRKVVSGLNPIRGELKSFKFQIREEEDEISYIDYLSLGVIREKDGVAWHEEYPLKWASRGFEALTKDDGKFLVLRKGDIVEFEVTPAELNLGTDVSVTYGIIAKGYYLLRH